MKTAISLPDDIFEKAERLARRLKKTRSQLYREAVAEYIARHDPDSATERMNRVIDEVGGEVDPFTRAAAYRAFKRVEW